MGILFLTFWKISEGVLGKGREMNWTVVVGFLVQKVNKEILLHKNQDLLFRLSRETLHNLAYDSANTASQRLMTTHHQ